MRSLLLLQLSLFSRLLRVCLSRQTLKQEKCALLRCLHFCLPRNKESFVAPSFEMSRFRRKEKRFARKRRKRRKVDFESNSKSQISEIENSNSIRISSFLPRVSRTQTQMRQFLPLASLSVFAFEFLAQTRNMQIPLRVARLARRPHAELLRNNWQLDLGLSRRRDALSRLDLLQVEPRFSCRCTDLVRSEPNSDRQNEAAKVGN